MLIWLYLLDMNIYFIMSFKQFLLTLYGASELLVSRKVDVQKLV